MRSKILNGKEPRRGFTLIELLIVIAIILILIAIALPNFLEAQLRAKVAKVEGDLRSIATAMESYFIQYRMYPPDHDPDAQPKGLYFLTTPIKFMTVVPEDSFNQAGTGFDPGEAFFEMASTGRPWVANPLFRNPPKINAYAVFSHGPAHRDTFSDNDAWPCSSPTIDPCPNTMGYLRYSPTNGSSSIGAILRAGGEVRSGNYCIDEWQRVKGYFPPAGGC
ncbi:MAG: hypothetical protein GHCLOJNM_00684 [bacterium]|nr:hypothetical protein [bacterium]